MSGGGYGGPYDGADADAEAASAAELFLQHTPEHLFLTLAGTVVGRLDGFTHHGYLVSGPLSMVEDTVMKADRKCRKAIRATEVVDGVMRGPDLHAKKAWEAVGLAKTAVTGAIDQLEAAFPRILQGLRDAQRALEYGEALMARSGVALEKPEEQAALRPLWERAMKHAAPAPDDKVWEALGEVRVEEARRAWAHKEQRTQASWEAGQAGALRLSRSLWAALDRAEFSELGFQGQMDALNCKYRGEPCDVPGSASDLRRMEWERARKGGC